MLPAIGDTGNARVGKSDNLILLCKSLTINCDGDFLRNSKTFLSLKKRVAQIKVLLMDVDGTMTDGGVTLLSQTEDVALETKPSTRTTDRVSHRPTSLASHGLHHWTPKLCSPSACTGDEYGIHLYETAVENTRI
jgi:hypothetical protein